MLGVWWNRIRNRLYDEHYFATIRPSAFVISVGNLSWGGTGKTSFVKQIASNLISNGNSVAIVSRGYGRTSSGAVLVADGRNIVADWKSAGEEAYWLARNLPKASVVVAEDRAAALSKLNGIDPQIIVLDDAFQHRRIARDLDLVLIDASENLQSQNVIPFGKLREPLDSLQRADAIILTHADHADANTTRWISENIRVPVFHANYRPFQPLPDPLLHEEGKSTPLDSTLSGKRIAAFCAIGSPHHFFNLLTKQGATLVLQKTFRDHHIYAEQELEQLQSEAKKVGAEMFATTEKDAVKLEGWFPGLPLHTVRVELVVKESEEFHEFLLQNIRNRDLKPMAERS
jgi:tetraacyldisaccharide 4'-kinase